MEIIMGTVFKRGAMLGCAIAVVNILDGIIPTPLDFMLLGSVILKLLPCHMTVPIGICQGRLLMLQLALEHMSEAEQEFQPNAIWIYLKWYIFIRERHLMQPFLHSSLTSLRC